MFYAMIVVGLAHAEDLCVLKVYVHAIGGALKSNTRVQLWDSKGSLKFNDLSAADGSVKICDFGFGPHSVIVGPDSCYPTSISIERIEPEHSIELHVIDNCPALPDVWRTFCTAYVRVKASSGAPVAGAVITPGSTRGPPVTDGYGRVWVYLKPGVIPLTISRDSFSPKVVPITCRHAEDIEKEIVLEPLAKNQK
jgi:hypothetical protein